MWDNPNTDNIMMSPRERRVRSKLHVARYVQQNLAEVARLGWTVKWLSSRRLTFNLDWDKKVVSFPYPKDKRGLACMAIAINTIATTLIANRPWCPPAWYATTWSQSRANTHRMVSSWERSAIRGGFYEPNIHDLAMHPSSRYHSGLWRVYLRRWYMPYRWGYGAWLKGRSPCWRKLYMRQVHMILRWMQRPEAWDHKPSPGMAKAANTRLWQAAVYRQRLLMLAEMEPHHYPLSRQALRIIRNAQA